MVGLGGSVGLIDATSNVGASTLGGVTGGAWPDAAAASTAAAAADKAGVHPHSRRGRAFG
jgi:hypothetical protein